MLALICILSWASICLLVVGLTMKGERALVRDRVEALQPAAEKDIEAIVPELTQSFSARIVRPWLGKITSGAARLLPGRAVKNAAVRLERAGKPWHLNPTEFVALKALSIIVFTGGGVTFAIVFDVSPIMRITGIAVGLVIGCTLPDSLLNQIIRERHRAMRKSLADCLDLLVVSAEAGLGFDGALAKVVERVRGPLSDEFRVVLNDMSIGRARGEALKAMSDRVGLAELTTFVAAIRQADMLGVSIAHVLRVQAESLRINRNIKAREAAAKLPVKLLFPLVFFIFPAIFIVILGPGVIQIFRALSTSGR